MEQLPKGLISLFISFIASQTTDEKESKKLVRKMMSLKSVQSIIVKAMYRLEPIINDELSHLRNPVSARSSSNPVRETRLLVLSNSIKHQLQNFLSIQDKITSVLNLVDNINFSVEPLPANEVRVKDPPNDLVNFLSSMSAKPQISNYEIEEISDNTWNKHMEVEKMLKVEMQKYYLYLDGLENKYFQRNLGIKYKAWVKIEKLELELKATWDHFRIMVDRASMSFEDMQSNEYEISAGEQKLLDQNSSIELQVKDYSSAVAKIKSMFTVRKILEKRKEQNDKLISGLNSKLSILSQRILELSQTNLNLIENSSSLSWCLEFIFNRSEMPEAVKTKALKLLEKQKCAKLEALFKIDHILEKYSVESVSKKFEELKEGLTNVSNSLKDENVKIKLSRLIYESRLDEIDKTETLKHIKVAAPAQISFGKQRGKARKDLLPQKEGVKKESYLEKMKREMMSISEEMQETDKQIEEMMAQNQILTNSSLMELVQKPKSRGNVVKSVNKSSLSPKSQKSMVRTEGSSNIYDDLIKEADIMKESKYTQSENVRNDVSTQMGLVLFEKVLELVNRFRARLKNAEMMKPSEVESFIFGAVRRVLKENLEKSVQTEKDPSPFEFSSPSSSLIRGIMSKVKNPKSDKVIKYKEPVNSNVSNNLIITKLSKKEESVFKTQILEIEEDNEKNSANRLKPSPPALIKPTTSTTPTSNLTSFLKNYSRVTSSKLAELSESVNKRQSHLELASEHYKKEFALQAQLRGIKKMSFEDIQTIWEEVINRRILDGEKDKISLYLRGYLGTDKYEEEKAKIIAMIQDETLVNKHLVSKDAAKLNTLKKWKILMFKFFEKKSFNFKGIIETGDSPREILFKVAKNLKFVKHRLRGRSSVESTKKRPEPLIYYSADKWSLNSTSVSPMESLRKSSRMIFSKKKVYPRLMAKTPVKEKPINLEPEKLPFI